MASAYGGWQLSALVHITEKQRKQESVVYLSSFAKYIDCPLYLFTAAYLHLTKVWDDVALQRQVMIRRLAAQRTLLQASKSTSKNQSVGRAVVSCKSKWQNETRL